MMVGYLEVEHPKLTWWKRMPEEHEGLVRNQEGAPKPGWRNWQTHFSQKEEGKT